MLLSDQKSSETTSQYDMHSYDYTLMYYICEVAKLKWHNIGRYFHLQFGTFYHFGL